MTYIQNTKEINFMQKPNVVFLFADQWRAQAIGFAGDENVKTPNIDNIAKESIVFSNAISGCPICSPYRASLLTGQNPLTTGIFMNDLCLSNNSISIAQAYSAEGYDTAYIGKWHLDGHGSTSYIPKQRRQGFEYWKVMECTHDYNNSAYYYGDNENIKTWDGYDAFSQTKDAIEYLNSRNVKDKPFFMMISYGPPHDPYHTAPKEYLDMYPVEDIIIQPNILEECEDDAKKFLQGYYAHISALDHCIGQIDQTIKKLGLMDNTIIVITSDHGDSVMSHCNAENGNICKQRPYDESIKVPFLLRYPNLLSNKDKNVLIPFSTPDIMPTLLELSGIPIPSSVVGMSFAPFLTNNDNIDREGVLIASYMPFYDWRKANGGKEYRGVRTTRYTYVKSLKGSWLLFDNINDPYQLKNLIDNAEYKDIQNHLDELLLDILDDQNDEFLPGHILCKKYGYHDLYEEYDTIPDYKGKAWYQKAEALRNHYKQENESYD